MSKFISASLHIYIRTKFPPSCPLFPSFSALFLSPAFLFSFSPNTLPDLPPTFLFLHTRFSLQFLHFRFLSILSLALHNSQANCYLSLSPKTLKPQSPLDSILILKRLSMSGPQAPTPSAQPAAGQIMQQPLRRQLPFSTLKPPFAAPADYHRFSDPRRGVADHEPEGIVVKSTVSFPLL